MEAGTLPVTAIVVALDDEKHLRESLSLLRGCAELYVVDLGSSDASRDVALECGATVVDHSRVSVVEEIYPVAIAAAANDWILTTDPDERVPAALLAELEALLPAIDADVGLIYAPLRYFFRGRALTGTVWGGERRRRLLLHRERVNVQPNVHAGIRLRPGFRAFEIAATPDNVVLHYWADGWTALLEKHRRYLTVEGSGRHRHGQRTRWREIVATPIVSFYDSYVRNRGYRDGLVGIALSLFWAWYSTRALAELRLYQRSVERE